MMLGAAAHTAAGNLIIVLLCLLAAALYGRWFLKLWPRRALFGTIWVIGALVVLLLLLAVQSAYYGAARPLYELEIVNLWNQALATAAMRWAFIGCLLSLIAAYLFLVQSRRRAFAWFGSVGAGAGLIYLITVEVIR